MKFLLGLIICSSVYQQCLPPYQWPEKFNSHYDCMRAGLSESYEILIADGNFTEEQINNLKLYPKFICQPVKDEGKITT